MFARSLIAVSSGKFSPSAQFGLPVLTPSMLVTGVKFSKMQNILGGIMRRFQQAVDLPPTCWMFLTYRRLSSVCLTDI